MTFTNMKIAARLALGFGLVMLLTAALFGLAIVSIENTKTNFDESNERGRRVGLADEWVASTRLNINRVMALAKSRNESAARLADAERRGQAIVEEAKSKATTAQKEVREKATKSTDKVSGEYNGQKVFTSLAQHADYKQLVIGAPEVWGIEALSGDQVVIRLAQQVRPAHSDEVARALRLAIKNALDAAKIELASNKHSIFVEISDRKNKA